MSKQFILEIVDYQKYEKEIQSIRREVFILEQGVSESLEIDGLDPECIHVLVWNEEGNPIGTGRMQKNGHIGRMAVIKTWRGMTVGRQILDLLILYAEEIGLKEVLLHSQTHAIAFYEKAGFVQQGDLFYEANIPHILMLRGL